jgi:amino acid transporter
MSIGPHEVVAPPSGGVETFGYRQELRRSLGLPELLAYGLVFIVPIAPISLFGFVFNQSFGMVPLVYLVGVVAMLFTAASYATMSRLFPVSGSVYAYAGRAMGHKAGFLGGWIMLLDYMLAPALVYIGAAIAIHAVMPQIPKVPCIVVLVLLNTIFATRGIQATARLSFAFLGLQIAVLVAFLGAAVVALTHGTNGAVLSTKPLFDPDHATPALIFSALSLATLSFIGFDAISTLSEESKEPRAVGRATYLSLLLVAGIFILQTYAACLFVLDRTHFDAGDRTEAAFYDIARDVGGAWLKWALTISVALFASIPNALAAQVASARLVFSMSRDSKLPRYFAHINERHGVPSRAAVLISGITLVLGIAFANRVELMATMVNFGALCGFLLVHLSVIAMAFKERERMKTLRSPLIAIVGALIIGYVLVNLNTTAMIVGLAWLALGVLLLMQQAIVAAPTPSGASDQRRSR